MNFVYKSACQGLDDYFINDNTLLSLENVTAFKAFIFVKQLIYHILKIDVSLGYHAQNNDENGNKNHIVSEESDKSY